MTKTDIQELKDFYKEHDLLDSKKESESLLSEAKRLNNLKKKRDEAIDFWCNNWGC